MAVAQGTIVSCRNNDDAKTKVPAPRPQGRTVRENRDQAQAHAAPQREDTGPADVDLDGDGRTKRPIVMQRYPNLGSPGRRLQDRQRTDQSAATADTWEREMRQRKDRRRQRPSARAKRIHAEGRQRRALPVELLASALAASVGVLQAAGAQGVSPQRLNNALERPPVREGYQRCQEIQQDCRRLLRESAPVPEISRRRVLPAADPSIAQSSISRALQRGLAAGAPGYLAAIRADYDEGQARIEEYRAALRQAVV